ncbi:MAG TPA: GYD domain-containing protein [Thermoplasmata archaeon]|nr:GYD domain-containing protein [Thermoplasmata archaeon]
MPSYMVQFSYSPESWAALMRTPEDRTAALDALAKGVGGKVQALYYHFGEFDGTVIGEFPDDAAVNAMVFAAVSSGAVQSTRTVRLFRPAEAIEALGKASKLTYRAPGK